MKNKLPVRLCRVFLNFSLTIKSLGPLNYRINHQNYQLPLWSSWSAGVPPVRLLSRFFHGDVGLSGSSVRTRSLSSWQRETDECTQIHIHSVSSHILSIMITSPANKHYLDWSTLLLYFQDSILWSLLLNCHSYSAYLFIWSDAAPTLNPSHSEADWGIRVSVRCECDLERQTFTV